MLENEDPELVEISREITQEEGLPEFLKNVETFFLYYYFNSTSRQVMLDLLLWGINKPEALATQINYSIEDQKERLTLRELLKLEAIATVCQLCEDFVRVLKTYKTSEKGLTKVFSSKMKVHTIKEFYLKEVPALADKDLLDMASIPLDLFEGLRDSSVVSVEELKGRLQFFRTVIENSGKFYIKYSELYNHYKHGHVVAPITAYEMQGDGGEEKREEKLRAMLFSFDFNGKFSVINIDRKKLSETFQVGHDILGTIRIIKSNWLARKRAEEKQVGDWKVAWHIDLPYRN